MAAVVQAPAVLPRLALFFLVAFFMLIGDVRGASTSCTEYTRFVDDLKTELVKLDVGVDGLSGLSGKVPANGGVVRNLKVCSAFNNGAETCCARDTEEQFYAWLLTAVDDLSALLVSDDVSALADINLNGLLAKAGDLGAYLNVRQLVKLLDFEDDTTDSPLSPDDAALEAAIGAVNGFLDSRMPATTDVLKLWMANGHDPVATITALQRQVVKLVNEGAPSTLPGQIVSDMLVPINPLLVQLLRHAKPLLDVLADLQRLLNALRRVLSEPGALKLGERCATGLYNSVACGACTFGSDRTPEVTDYQQVRPCLGACTRLVRGCFSPYNRALEAFSAYLPLSVDALLKAAPGLVSGINTIAPVLTSSFRAELREVVAKVMAGDYGSLLEVLSAFGLGVGRRRAASAVAVAEAAAAAVAASEGGAAPSASSSRTQRSVSLRRRHTEVDVEASKARLQQALNAIKTKFNADLAGEVSGALCGAQLGLNLVDTDCWDGEKLVSAYSAPTTPNVWVSAADADLKATASALRAELNDFEKMVLTYSHRLVPPPPKPEEEEGAEIAFNTDAPPKKGGNNAAARLGPSSTTADLLGAIVAAAAVALLL